MKIASYVNSTEEIDICKSKGIDEIILAPLILSRFGRLTMTYFIELSKYAKQLGFNISCEWDILLTENSFKELLSKISTQDFKYIDEIRVQDTGVLNYILKHYTQKIQFLAETNNHNLNSLLAFEKIIGPRLSRIILSLELPLDKLQEFSTKLNTATEITVFGRINLFYSPRKLISPYLNGNDENKTIEIEVNSEESPHKGFPLIQNRHGTFMQNPKDHCLLENITDLESAKVSFLKLDLRFDESFKKLDLILKILKNKDVENNLNRLKIMNKRPLIRGFFRINKTDHQFKKLKNLRIQRTDKNYIGEVLDVKKGLYIGLRVKDNASAILLGGWIELRTPEGKVKKLQIKSLKNSSNEDINNIYINQIVYINHVSGISIKTAIYFSQ
ncbi:MAG: hypothetical protein HN576_12310 [Bacteriovoracaceae bacterium]|jgi:U32 family peptidase|nr:hypothetical protein [Bacteriovoracaceae bacterium]